MIHIKKIVTSIFLSLVISAVSYGQDVLVRFSYDANGNRVERRLVVEKLEYGNNPLDSVVEGAINDACITPDKATNPIFKVYPNPTKEMVIVDCQDETIGVCHVLLYSPLGVLLEECIFSRTATIDLSRRQSGVYLVKIIQGTQTQVWRVVKQ